MWKSYAVALLMMMAPFAHSRALAGSVVSDKDSPHPVRFAAVFTFLDAVVNTKRVWSLEDVRQAISIARKLGVQRLYWRIDAGGFFVYPTKAGAPYRWDGRNIGTKYVFESIQQLGDPLRVFAEEAKAQGIEFYAWYPIRDRNATSYTYNPENPEEASRFAELGRYPMLSPFYAAHPEYNMERRQGDGGRVVVPRIKGIKIRTSRADLSLSKEDVQVWESDNNLRYNPVPDTWRVAEETGANGNRGFTITGLDITKPWVKISQRIFGKWEFSGGTIDDWVTVLDAHGKEWFPRPWIAANDKDPGIGEASFPYKSASRAMLVRNEVPWDAITKFRFGSSGASLALYTPDMPAERYLWGYPCFAIPEVKAHELRVIEELLEYPLDGIAICLRTHVRTNIGEDYGFNAPVVKEYERRYGVNIIKEPFDQAKLLEIHGDAFTDLLKQMAIRVHGKGRRLVAMYEPEVDLGLEFQPGQMSPWWDIGGMNWQWKKWAGEGMVDELMVFTTGFNLPWDQRLQRYLRLVREAAPGVEVSLFYDPDYDPRRQSNSAFLKVVKGALACPDIDELNVFEFVDFWLPSLPLHEAVLSLGLKKDDLIR